MVFQRVLKVPAEKNADVAGSSKRPLVLLYAERSAAVNVVSSDHCVCVCVCVCLCVCVCVFVRVWF